MISCAIKLLIVAALVLVIGCDDMTIASVENHPSRTEVRSVDCDYFGYCYHCGLNLGSTDYKCGFGLSYFCSGKQSAEVRLTPQTLVYKSGRTENAVRRETGKVLSECKP